MREEEKRTSPEKRFSKKRWVFPAIYIASAALILTAVYWYQTSDNNVAKQNEYNYNATDVPGKNFNQPAMEVNRALENFVWPVKNAEEVVIHKQFYDMNGTPEQQEKALVTIGNMYQPNTGIDITMKNGETFDVVAALSGTVTRVQEDATLGNVIVIEHDNNIVTQYQSLKDISVEVGAQVKQGQAIAKAGQSMLNEEAGVHVHFEIRKDNRPVNPIEYFGKTVTDLQSEKPAEDKAKVNDEEEAEEESPTDKEEDKNGSGESTDPEAEQKKSES